MAFATPKYPKISTHFLDEVISIRKEINSKFEKLVNRVNSRRDDMLRKLDEIEYRYNTLIRDGDLAFKKLEEMKTQTNDILDIPFLNSLNTKFQTGLDLVIKEITEEMNESFVNFEWSDSVEEMVTELGVLYSNLYRVGRDDRLMGTIDYAAKYCSILNYDVSGRRSNVGKYRGICVDLNSNIYITCGSEVKMFNEMGRNVLNFRINGEMLESPSGIGIYESEAKNKLLYISQYKSNRIITYQLNSDIREAIRINCSGKGELSSPKALTVDESNGHVYVCNSDQLWVTTFDKFLVYRSEIKDETEIKSTSDRKTSRDVKVSDTRIFILCKCSGNSSSELIHVYKKSNHELLRTLLGDYSYFDPTCFDIDQHENILVLDSRRRNIYIYNRSGQFTHSLQMSEMCDRKSDCYIVFDKKIGKIWLLNGNRLYIF